MKKPRNMRIKVMRGDTVHDDVLFWQSITPDERITAVEFLREQFYALQGYTEIPRMIKKITIRSPKQ